MIALCVAAGYALAAVPNVELITLLVFVSGFLLGRALGALVGALSMAGHSTFNVMGAAIPPILAAQVACYSLVGLAGATLGPHLLSAGRGAAALASALCAVALVLVYQVVVGVVSFYTFTGESMLWTYVWGGVVFSAVHIAWNAALFGVVLRPTLAVLDRHRHELRRKRA
jgi:hypothetical protein